MFKTKHSPVKDTYSYYQRDQQSFHSPPYQNQYYLWITRRHYTHSGPPARRSALPTIKEYFRWFTFVQNTKRHTSVSTMQEWNRYSRRSFCRWRSPYANEFQRQQDIISSFLKRQTTFTYLPQSLFEGNGEPLLRWNVNTSLFLVLSVMIWRKGM